MADKTKQSILLVDSDSVNQVSVRHALRNLDVAVVIAPSTNDVAVLALTYDFALILMMVTRDDASPFELAVELGKNEKTRYIPIIFQAEKSDALVLQEQGYAAGCVDFVYKPLQPAVFLAKVKVFLELDSRQRQLVLATAKIQEQNLKLEERAIRDSLTGLYNHNYLLDQLSREVSMARRYNTSLSVFLLDLDFFKDVNDTCGHPFGDFVLQEFSTRVKGRLRDTDIFGRYGGEEFIIILPNTGGDRASIVAEKIREVIASTPFDDDRCKRFVTVSIGVYSGFGEKTAASRVVVDCVDSALYEAKAEGRNRVVHYHLSSGADHGESGVPLSDMIDRRRQGNLNATIEKARSMTLASFEAMVHSQTREYDLLGDRNALFLKVLDRLGDKLSLPDQLIHSCRRAVKLHDLFRCYIRDSSLETEGPLNSEQEEMLLDQPLMLRELTTMFDFFAYERTILYSHHEHYDGSGYPAGLKGHEIPMAARIFALVDAFVAMAAPVAKRKKKSITAVKKELCASTGSQFDPFLVDILMKILEDEEILLNKKS